MVQELVYLNSSRGETMFGDEYNINDVPVFTDEERLQLQVQMRKVMFVHLIRVLVLRVKSVHLLSILVLKVEIMCTFSWRIGRWFDISWCYQVNWRIWDFSYLVLFKWTSWYVLRLLNKESLCRSTDIHWYSLIFMVFFDIQRYSWYSLMFIDIHRYSSIVLMFMIFVNVQDICWCSLKLLYIIEQYNCRFMLQLNGNEALTFIDILWYSLYYREIEL